MSGKKQREENLSVLATSKDLDTRCKVAESPDTPPEILFFLANDLSPEVRLHVAQNPSAPWEADTLLSKDVSDDIRAALTDKIIERLERNEAHKNSKPGLFQRALKKIGRVFEDLVDDSVTYIRRKVARTIIAKGYFPKEMVLKLVNHQDREIAVYTINHATAFSDTELLGFLDSEKDFVPEAIAHRQNLSSTVVDALVERGNPASLKCMLDNPSAHISSEAMEKIITQSKEDTPLQESIVRRRDLDLGLIQKIALIVSGSMLKELILTHRLSKKDATSVLEQVRDRLDGEEMAKIVKDVLSNEFYKSSSLEAPDRAYQDFLRSEPTSLKPWSAKRWSTKTPKPSSPSCGGRALACALQQTSKSNCSSSPRAWSIPKMANTSPSHPKK